MLSGKGGCLWGVGLGIGGTITFQLIPTMGFIRMGMVGRTSASLLVPLPTEDEDI